MTNINFEEAEKHLRLLDELSEKFTFQTFDDSSLKRAHLARVIHGSFDDVKDQLANLNQQGAGIFITVNETDLKGRTALNIKRIRSYIAEADGPLKVEPELRPTFSICSKRGKHFYWVLKDFNEDKSKFTPIEESINKTLGTDPTVKDLPRVLRLAGFLHKKDPHSPWLVEVHYESMEYYTQEEIESVFPPLTRHTRIASVGNNGKKGTLMPKVQEFLTKPWKGTAGDNGILVLAISNLKKNNYSIEECIELLEGKGEKLDRNTMIQVNAVYKSPEYRVDPFITSSISSYNDFILGADLYKDILDEDTIYVVDRKLQRIERIKQATIDAIVGKKERHQRLVLCKTAYNPNSTDLILPDQDGFPMLNSYNPPFWKKQGAMKTVEDKMPEVYEAFFAHLFPVQESRKYVLDWIAFSLRGKNIATLALVGTNRGIGKNVLGTIIQELHGKDNSEIAKQSLLTKEFNQHLESKTFIQMDEVSINKDSELEAIKAYTNTTINYEGKGKDSSTRPFWGNTYLTNNKLECLSGVAAEDDRQFSIPEVTLQKLDVARFKKFRPTELTLNWMWEDRELLGRLASYLWHRDLSEYDFVTNFKSSHYYEVIRTSTPEWLKFILEDVRSKHLNCAIKFIHLKNLLSKSGEAKIGRAKLESACHEHSDMIGYKKIDNVPHLFFSKNGESYMSFQKRLRDDVDSFNIMDLPHSLIG